MNELKVMIEKEKGGRVYQRLLAIRMFYLGESVPKIASIPSVEESSVYEWIRLWNKHGYDGITPAITVIYLPLFVILMLVTALGVGFWLSALNVEYWR